MYVSKTVDGVFGGKYFISFFTDLIRLYTNTKRRLAAINFYKPDCGILLKIFHAHRQRMGSYKVT